MRQGDIVWCTLPPPDGRRPVLILTRTPALEFLSGITVAPLTRTARPVPSFVTVSASEGMPADSMINCDQLTTVPAESLEDHIMTLSRARLRQVRSAVEFALALNRLGEG